MLKRSFPLPKVYGLLESGPVVMVTTSKGGKVNIMPMSWHTMIDFEPPLVGLIISDRSHTFKILKSTKECVINIPTMKIGKKVVACGKVSGRKIDKFKEFGLTQKKASLVNAPLIEECYANLECKVIDTKMTGKYNLFIVKVVKAWIDPSVKEPRTLHHHGGGNFTTPSKKFKIN